jgi:hypothetical protein
VKQLGRQKESNKRSMAGIIKGRQKGKSKKRPKDEQLTGTNKREN